MPVNGRVDRKNTSKNHRNSFMMEVTCVHQSKTSHHVPPVHFSSQTCFRLFIVFSGVSNTLVNHSCTAVADVRITCCELGSAICLSVDSGSCPFGHCAWGCLGLLPLCICVASGRSNQKSPRSRGRVQTGPVLVVWLVYNWWITRPRTLWFNIHFCCRRLRDCSLDRLPYELSFRWRKFNGILCCELCVIQFDILNG